MRPPLSSLTDLLQSKQPELVRQGVELALTLPELRDALLEGCTLVEATPGFFRVEPGPRLQGPSTNAGGREYACLRLLADRGELPSSIRLEARTPAGKRRRTKGLLPLLYSVLHELPLTGVSLEDPPPLEDLPDLERLEVEQSGLPSQALLERAHVLRLALQSHELRALPTSAELHLSLPTLDSLPALPGLRGLQTSQCWGLETLEALRACPRLRVLRLGPAGSLQDASALERCEELQELVLSASPVPELPIGRAPLRVLDLRGCWSLQGLPDLVRSPGLRELCLERCAELRELPRLPPSPAITRLELSGLPLTSIEPLAALTGLEWLRLDGTHVQDLSPLRGLTRLRLLDLRQTRAQDLSPLAGMHELRCLALRGAPALKKDASEPLQRWVTTAKSPNLTAMAAREPAQAREPLAAGTAKRVARLRRLLTASSTEDVCQGLELLAALEDPAVVEEFLREVEWRPVGKKGFKPTSPRLSGRRSALVVLSLLKMAPEARPDLRQVQSLDLVGQYHEQGLRPVDLDSLSALPRLTALRLARGGPLLGGGASVTLPELRRVSIEACGPARVGWLSGAPKLDRLVLGNLGVTDFSGIAGCGVKTLVLSATLPTDFADLAGCARLREIRTTNMRGVDWSGLKALTGLRHLEAPLKEVLPDLPGVTIKRVHW